MKVRPSNASGGVAIGLSRHETQIPAPSAPFQLKRILVPVDFSECSNKAVMYAEAIAKQFNAQLVLLHVIEECIPTSDLALVDTAFLLDDIRKRAKQNITEIHDQLDPVIKSVTKLGSGTPYSQIVRAARESDIDLIIISTHGRSGFVHAFMGSTAERVVRHASCPVLVVRERERDFVPNVERKKEQHAGTDGGAP